MHVQERMELATRSEAEATPATTELAIRGEASAEVTLLTPKQSILAKYGLDDASLDVVCGALLKRPRRCCVLGAESPLTTEAAIQKSSTLLG